MKRSVSTLFAILLCTILSAKVNFYGEELAIGIKGGTAISRTFFTPAVNQNMKIDYCGGIVCRYCGEKNFGLQVELNYQRKGWQESDIAFRRTLEYIELPMMSHFFFGKGIFRWLVNVGPQVGFIIRDTYSGDPSEPQHIEPIKRRFDYGLCGGTGFEFNTLKGGIYQIEGRFNYSFADFFDHAYTTAFQQSAAMNITVTLGILFNIPTKHQIRNNTSNKTDSKRTKS